MKRRRIDGEGQVQFLKFALDIAALEEFTIETAVGAFNRMVPWDEEAAIRECHNPNKPKLGKRDIQIVLNGMRDLADKSARRLVTRAFFGAQALAAVGMSPDARTAFIDIMGRALELVPKWDEVGEEP